MDIPGRKSLIGGRLLRQHNEKCSFQGAAVEGLPDGFSVASYLSGGKGVMGGLKGVQGASHIRKRNKGPRTVEKVSCVDE